MLQSTESRQLSISVLAALLCCLVSSTGLQAQADDPQAYPVHRSGPWFVAAGLDPYGLDLRTKEPGVHGDVFGSVGRDVWRHRTARRTLRLQLSVGAALPNGIALEDASCRNCEVRYSRRSVALSAIASQHIGPILGLRPYVLGGPSLQSERTGFTIRGGPLTVAATSQVPLPTPATRWMAGLFGGAGIGANIGGAHVFVEQWMQMPRVLSSPRTGADEVRWPLMMGLRF
jgi:hypothetical protein